MRDDLPEAAFRLLNTLPVRTHLQAEIQRKHYKRRANPESIARKIKIGGVVYLSAKEARKLLRIGQVRLGQLIAAGQAKYV